MSKPLFLGIDVGGTNLRLGVYEDCTLRWDVRVPALLSELFRRADSPAAATSQLLDLLKAGIDQALHAQPGIQGIGIGFPGFISPKTHCLSQSPNMPGLHDWDMVTPLRAHSGLPVYLENDALAAAYGEYALTGGMVENMIFMGLGTGVGGGLILGRSPFPGEHGVAMEVGHIIVDPGGRLCGCGNKGCLEQYASATGIQNSYAAAVPGERLNTKQIAERAAQGDVHALAAFQLAGDTLGYALANMLKVLDLEYVVIGGGVAAAWDLFYPALRQRLEADLIPALRGKIRVEASRSEDRAGILGAAMLAARLLPGTGAA
ncbi:ROK family protein [Thermithiobacillus plumbiphilus]|uniref:ROK family protein n=1 Tax=Thermithiobacillus plumbiphilus TaxID=1729899 RepID=A0ABU9D4G4_9PROT